MGHAARGGRSALAAVSAVVLVGVLAAASAWFRLGPVARGTVWAEDGGLFLREHLALGPVASLLHPYAGYLHLVPRLVVDLALLFPVADYALVVSATSCLLAGAVCAAVFVLARDVVPSWPLRLVLAVVPVALPTAPWEVSGNAANLHTFALFLAPWALAHRSRTWWGAGALGVVTVLVLATEAQAVLFLPLLVLAWLPAPRGGGRLLALPVTVAAVAAATAQVVTALTTPRASTPGHPTVPDVVAGWLLQTIGGLWDADLGAVAGKVVDHGWWVLAVPSALVLVVVLLGSAVALRTGRGRAAVLALALAVAAAVVWTAALLANRSADGRWSQVAPAALLTATPSRYAAAAGMLLTAAVVVAAAVLVDRVVTPGGSGRRVAVRASRPGGAAHLVGAAVGWCVVAVLVTTWVVNAPGSAQRSTGPEWQPQFRDAVATCRADPTAVLDIRTQPWGAAVPCTLVLRDG
ncbi:MULTISPECIES: hypothetical protein [unclassified Curtobacterium]|uniref:hypothetical protein n=1 Tax=unclassified Curtobacterium TaxID=257496 RepID=UPI000DA9B0E3|nr:MULTISPECIES: hypothetical protein [unclassified Curtobacterium]PZE36211.1 hypothetical protein DEJ31_10710 [Curtobacterium sp. MCPF17_031]PZF12579.1 hypothetical protein DEJ25_07510 [Curtobacterium sp. MCPF17_011]